MRGLPMRARSGPYNRQEMKWGVFFCKIVDLFSTQGALCTVSVFLFYILLIWGRGAYAPNALPAYGPVDRRITAEQI